MNRLCSVAVVLWVVVVGAAGWFFVKGTTTAGRDGRTEIQLHPEERDLILGEMRGLLEAINGILGGLGETEATRMREQVAQAARGAGMGMAEDVNPALMAKLPLPFKQLGMSVHRDFDEIAAQAERGADEPEIIKALSSITSRCTACHAMYRLADAPNGQ